MQRKILDEPLSIRELGELIALDRASGAVHQWKFHDYPDVGGVAWQARRAPVTARPGYRLRLVVLEEPQNMLPIDEKVVEAARERLRCHLVRATFNAGYTELELRDLTDAIEDLVAARIGRALRIHCDADHNDDE